MLKCSIIIPTFNRKNTLEQCYNSVKKQKYDLFEIIIVDDCSTDETKNFLDGLQSNDGRPTKVIHNPINLGPAESRNIGIKNSSAEYLVFVDDDCIPKNNCWLKNLMNKFNDQRIGFIIGQIFNVHPNNTGYFPEKIVCNIKARWPMLGNMAYKKRVFAMCGLFNNEYYKKFNNEDTEMAIRAVSKGWRYSQALDSIVIHQKIFWTQEKLIDSAKNASVWITLKREYPSHFMHFKPDILFNKIIHPKDYLFILFLPIVLPLLFFRYLLHGQKNLKIFFYKWPIFLFLKRYFILKAARENKIFML